MSLFSRLFAPKKPRPMITQGRLSSLINEQIPMASNCKIRFADSAYICADKEETFRFARNSATFYEAEVGDCDDASILCKSEAIKWARRQGLKYPLAVGIAFVADKLGAVSPVTKESVVAAYLLGRMDGMNGA